MLFLPRIGRTSTRQKGTGAQTITVIMENHVLLSRRRPADWLTAGARRGSCTSNRKTRRGVEGGEAMRRRKGKKKKRQRGEKARPCSSTSLVIFACTFCPCQGASPSPPPSSSFALLVHRSPLWRRTDWYVP